MSIDIADLDLLPETDPVALADLDELGLMPCWITCLFGRSCRITVVA